MDKRSFLDCMGGVLIALCVICLLGAFGFACYLFSNNTVQDVNEYDYSWLREWRIKTSQVLINEDNAIVIAKDEEELFNLTYDLGDIDFDGDVEDNGSVFLGFAEGRFTRKYKGVSLDEINQANGMSKSEIEETLSNQIPGEEEGRSLGIFISNI